MKLRFVFAALLYLSILSGLFAQTEKLPKRSVGLANRTTPTGAIQQRDGTTTTASQQAQTIYGRLPLRFEANQGQTDDRVKFLAHAKGYTVFLTPNEAVLSVRQSKYRRAHATAASPIETQQGIGHDTSKTGIVRLKLVGSDPLANIEGRDELPGKSNYFIGSNPAKWRTNVPSYARIQFENAYPGIDVSYYGTRNKLETDYIVAPGTNPSQIRLAIDGATRVRLDSQGNLRLRAADGDLVLERPLAYQGEADAKRMVRAEFVLVSNDRRGSRVGFRVDPYDSSKPLVIDPVLTYSTYLGGSAADEAYSIAVDASGSAYVVGATASSNFPTTPQTFQASSKGGSCAGLFQTDPVCGDAFVTKLDPQGSSVVYSTYLGGSGADWAVGIALDASDNAYIAGHTSSMDFPTTPGALQTTCGPCDSSGAPGNGFITKLNPQGNSLVYSTYLGGTADTNQDTNYDPCGSIAVDSSGSAYVTGCTTSVFPTTPGAFQTTASSTGYVQGFVAKVNSTGSALIYSTYLAGPSFDQTKGIVVDGNGDAYITGFASPGFPVTPGAFQTDAKGSRQAFVTELNPTGSALVYSTFLGGSAGQQFGTGIALDSSGNVYVTGSTTTTDFPVTPGAFQTMFGGASDGFGDAFVTKLNASGSALVYSTYLGGSADDFGSSIAIDSSGNAVVTGFTASPNFPLSNAFQSKSGGGTDAFVAELDPTGSSLVFSTYLGGSQNENFSGDLRSGAVAIDSQGNAYVAGFTSSSSFPVTPGAAQTSFGGGVEDAFVAKISKFVTPTGTIAITTNLSAASFTVTGPATFSGTGTSATFNNAPVGSYTITFAAVAGYTAPAPQTQTLTAGGTINFTGTYNATLMVASTNPNGGVSVTAVPADINGQANVSTPVTLTYNAGTPVALTAQSAFNGNTFANWTGCDSAPGLTCNVVMTGDHTVTANYLPPQCSTTVTAVNVTTNTNCKASISSNCSANIVLGDGSETTQATTRVQPAQSVSVSLSTTFGAAADVQTNTSGVGSSLYTAGSMTAGGTSTTVAAISAKVCQSMFQNLTQVFNYRGFEFHESQVTDIAFTDSPALDSAGIQAFLNSQGSFLAKFVFVGTTGGFVDVNGNGMLDNGEPTYSATGVPVPLHSTGRSAAAVLSTIALNRGINPKILLATLEKESSLISQQSLPIIRNKIDQTTTILNFAMGCNSKNQSLKNFAAQLQCAAMTFINLFNESALSGRTVNYPFFFRSVDGIHHAVTAPCNLKVLPSGCKSVAFNVVNAATFAQYRYTPFIQALVNGGGVYRFEYLWSLFKF